MRGARDFPRAETVRVRLPRAREPGGEVGLGLEHQDRHVEIGAQARRRGRRHIRLRRLRERRADAEAAVHEVAVVGVRDRRHRVEVGHEPERRL